MSASQSISQSDGDLSKMYQSVVPSSSVTVAILELGQPALMLCGSLKGVIDEMMSVTNDLVRSARF